MTSEFVIKHDEIDTAIKNEKRRAKTINKRFAIIDFIVGLAIITFFLLLAYIFQNIHFKYPD